MSKRGGISPRLLLTPGGVANFLFMAITIFVPCCGRENSRRKCIRTVAVGTAFPHGDKSSSSKRKATRENFGHSDRHHDSPRQELRDSEVRASLEPNKIRLLSGEKRKKYLKTPKRPPAKSQGIIIDEVRCSAMDTPLETTKNLEKKTI